MKYFNVLFYVTLVLLPWHGAMSTANDRTEISTSDADSGEMVHKMNAINNANSFCIYAPPPAKASLAKEKKCIDVKADKVAGHVIDSKTVISSAHVTYIRPVSHYVVKPTFPAAVVAPVPKTLLYVQTTISRVKTHVSTALPFTKLAFYYMA